MMVGLGFIDIYAILLKKQLQILMETHLEKKDFFTTVSILWIYILKICSGYDLTNYWDARF